MKLTVEEKRARHAAYMREYCEKNREKIRAQKRAQRAANNEAYRAYARAWRLANPGKVYGDVQKHLAQARQWKKDNPEKSKEYKRRDYQKHKSKRLAAGRAYYKNNKEKLAKQQKEWYNKNRERIIKKQKEDRMARLEFHRERSRRSRVEKRAYHAFHSTKKSAKNLGVEFDLTVEWYQWKYDRGSCEMSGLPFDMGTKRGPNSPSVDRKDPKGPYTKENCRMILWFINRAMMDLGEEYCMKVFRGIVAHPRVTFEEGDQEG